MFVICRNLEFSTNLERRFVDQKPSGAIVDVERFKTHPLDDSSQSAVATRILIVTTNTMHPSRIRL